MQDASRHLRFQRAVEASGAAADLGVPHLDKVNARQRADQIPRLLLDPLRVREMTRVLIRDPDPHLMSRRGEADLGQPFSEVFDPAFQLGVEILEVRAATGRVDHECVEVSAAISLHVRVAQPGGRFANPLELCGIPGEELRRGDQENRQK